MTEKSDISTEADIHKLVSTFYERVNQDPVLGPIFNDVAKVNWEEHIPLLSAFWSSLLLRSGSYKGNPFARHMFLPIRREHFGTWLSLFKRTVDDLFVGPKAAEAKNFAASIADSFQVRLGLLTAEDFLSRGKLGPISTN